MPTTLNSNRYMQDVPWDIKEKIALLREQKRRMAYLRETLEILENCHRQLEEELELYLIPAEEPYWIPVEEPGRVAKRPSRPAYIDRLPNEILYLIFEGYLNLYPRAILYLLPVCRRWNHLVIGCPTLWTRIQLDWTTRPYFKSPMESPLLYISACLKHSRDLMLKIDFNLHTLPDSADFLKYELGSCLKSLTSPNQRLCLSPKSWELMHHMSPFYRMHTERLLDCLFGANREHVVRWSSLRFFMGYRDPLGESLWGRFKGAALPNLREFSIDRFDKWRYDQSILKQDFNFMDLSNVMNLVLADTPPVSSFPVSHTTLQYLEICIANPVDYLTPLSNFRNLKTLTIREFGYAKEVSSVVIQLPRLEEMNLFYRYLRDPYVGFSWAVLTRAVKPITEMGVSS